MLNLPLRWKKPRQIFVNSMSDRFHHMIPFEFLSQIIDVMTKASQHTFQILTKRAGELFTLAPRIDFPKNVWLGVTVENVDYKARIDCLRGVNANIRFLSCEPLLGPLGVLDLSGIDWVIAGGESGPGARPMKKEWVTELRDQCLDQGIPFFFKQWGESSKKKNGRELEGKIWTQMPVCA